MNIIKKLKQFTDYSETERFIVQFILQNPEIFLKSTVKELAILTHSSSATIVRLCQKFGFSGYHDFKIQFASDQNSIGVNKFNTDANYPFNIDDDLNSIVQKLSDLQLSALNETLMLVEMNNYENAIQLLYQADCIDIYGAGINVHLAFDFYYRLKKINKLVELPQNHHDQLFNAARSSSKHCALIISYSGESDVVLNYATLLKESNTPIISITSMTNNSLSKFSDILLHIVSKEKVYSKIGSFSSRLSIMMILDIIYAGIFQKDYTENIIYSKQISNKLLSFNRLNPPLHED